MIKSVHNYPISQLFDIETSVVYRVPRYQREYTWTKHHWESLFDDLLENDEGYFLGSIICINQSDDALSVQELEVVDGQQRLMTLSLLFAAIYDHLHAQRNSLDDDQQVEVVNLKRKLVLKFTPPPMPVRVMVRSLTEEPVENLWDAFFDGLGCPALKDDPTITRQGHPDTALCEQALRDRPTLFVLDELEDWLAQWDQQKRRRNLEFLKVLTGLAQDKPNFLLAASILGNDGELEGRLVRDGANEVFLSDANDQIQVILTSRTCCSIWRTSTIRWTRPCRGPTCSAEIIYGTWPDCAKCGSTRSPSCSKAAKSNGRHSTTRG